jgi:hypothetical protein
MAREYGTGSVLAHEAEVIRNAEIERKAKQRLIVVIAVCAIMLVAGGLTLLKGLQDRANLPIELSYLDEEVDTAMAEYNDTKALYDMGNGKTIVHVQPEMSTAAIAGQSVCDLQNQLIKLHYDYLAAKSMDPNTQMTDEHVDAIQKYNNYMASGSGSPNNEPWTVKGYWFFGNTYEYRGTGTHTVVWKCYSQNTTHSPLYAVATAVYYPLKSQFSDLHIYKLAAYDNASLEFNPDGTEKVKSGLVGADEVPSPDGIAPTVNDQSHDPSVHPTA